MKVTVDPDTESEEDEEAEVVVELEQGPSSLSHQDRITGRQFDRVQVSHKRLLDPKPELFWGLLPTYFL